MPLDLKEEGDIRSSIPSPVLHQPGNGKSGAMKVILIILAVVAVGAGAYLVYKSNLFSRRGTQRTVASQPSQPPATTELRAGNAPSSEEPKPEEAAQVKNQQTNAAKAQVMPPPQKQAARQRPSPAEGNYTIYIGRHRTKEVADGEAGAWNGAGYETTVTELDGWYRVSIGRYRTWDEAKAVAVKLSDGLEAGYKIGKISE